MTITISPLTVNLIPNCHPTLTLQENKGSITDEYPHVTYWGIYLDGKYVSYTSSRERAEKTKV